MCPQFLATWAGSRTGPPVSECVHISKEDVHTGSASVGSNPVLRVLFHLFISIAMTATQNCNFSYSHPQRGRGQLANHVTVH